MTKAEAARPIALLIGYFPEAVLEEGTVELWVAEIEQLKNPEKAKEAARLLGTRARKMPSLAEFLDTYRSLVMRIEASKHPELEGVTSGQRELPDSVKEWLARGPREIE